MPASPLPSRRVYRLRQFSAHNGAAIESVSMGRHSGRVLATGGADGTIHLWAIGRPEPVVRLSLPNSVDIELDEDDDNNDSDEEENRQPHQPGVPALAFDSAEKQVAAGSHGGDVYVWDLSDPSQTSCLELLGAHSDAISALAFHPAGGHLASAGTDGIWRLWDIRSGTCLQKHRGHDGRIQCVRFSPDGQWVVSGGSDGEVILWDLKKGKQLHTFKDKCEAELQVGTRAPVVDVVFHPTEFLLATADADGVTTFWDLGSMELLSTVPSNMGRSVQRIQFDPQGTALLAADADALHVWCWDNETGEQHRQDTVPVNWGNLVDAHITASRQYVGCAIDHEYIIIWAMGLQRLRPWAQTVVEKPCEDTNQSAPSFEQQQEAGPLSRRSSDHFERKENVGSPRVDLSTKAKQTTPAPMKDERRESVQTISTTSTPAKEGTNSSAGVCDKYLATASLPADMSDPTVILTQEFAEVDVLSGSSIEDIRAAIMKDNSVMISTLERRLKSLQTFCDAWDESEGILEAIALLRTKIDDPAVAIDILNVLQRQTNLLTLESCALLLPILRGLVSAEYPGYVSAALRMAAELAKIFGPDISDLVCQRTTHSTARADHDRKKLRQAECCLQHFRGLQKGVEAVRTHHKSPLISKPLHELTTSLQWITNTA